MGLKTQADWLAGRQATQSGRGTVGVRLFPANDRCYTERERDRGESFAAARRVRDHREVTLCKWQL